MAVDRTRREASFPNHLEDERAAAGIKTQKELAELARIEPTWYSRIESGRVLATPEELDAIVAALGNVPLTRIYDRPFLEAIGAARRASASVGK